MREVESRFAPQPPQRAFRLSPARVRGFGGAMGGGKSRCLCETAFDIALDHPGCRILICRQTHTSIIETTRRTMMDEVVPPECIKEKKESGGEDYIKLWNGSQINFIGLEDPVRWFSSELGALVFDEAHEIEEDTVTKLMTRLRQRRMPHTVFLGFNPENPGHWLYRWFIAGAEMRLWDPDTEPYTTVVEGRERQVEYAGKLKGYWKKDLYTTGADAPVGSAEFIFSKATDNVHLPERYIQDNLASLKPLLRRRYLEGEWVYTDGQCFFDTEALDDYSRRISPPWRIGILDGDPTNKDVKDRPRFKPRDGGGWWIWKPPVRENRDKDIQAHRYVAAVDVSSGTANDYSAIQVVDVDSFEQVAEFQGLIDPDLLALEAARIGHIYNTALIAPEVTGGFGTSVIRKLETLRYRRMYTRRVEDRLAKKFTDVLGWDTQKASRMYMLDKLEEVLRERDFGLKSPRTLAELSSFVYPKKRGKGDFEMSPRAQPGANDDLVLCLAICIAVALKQPKELRRRRRRDAVPELVTGY